MPTYDLDYALDRLREAIDFAEAEGDFTQARKWANEVELAAKSQPGITRIGSPGRLTVEFSSDDGNGNPIVRAEQ